MVGTFNLPTDTLENCSKGFLWCFADWASQVTTGAFWVLALLTFTVVIYLATARYGGTRAFGFASFTGLLGGIWLSVLQLIPWWVGSTFIIIGIIGIVSLIISDK